MNELICILAQAPGAAAGLGESAASLEVQSVWDFVRKGGLMMIPIGLCSFVALTVIVERLISLRRSNVMPRGFVEGLKEVLNAKAGDKQAAIAYCSESGSPVANVFAAGIKKLDHSTEIVESRIQEAGEREALKLRKFLRALSVIASVTPLMGLLGTIFGMIKAFQTVATSADALGKTEMLAGGIYEAMITTAAGLLVAIPVLICFHVISAKIDRLVMDIDRLTVDFIEEFVEPEPASAPSAAKTAKGDGALAVSSAEIA